MSVLKKQLLDDGFCIINDVISPEVVSKLRQQYLPHFSANKLTFTTNEILSEPDLYDILFSSEVIENIINLLGRSYFMYPDFTLRSSVYVPWHTDVPYLTNEEAKSSILANFMQVSLYLQDNTIESGGGLDAIAGSHRYTGIDYKNFNADDSLDTSNWVQIPSRAGGLTIWDSRLIHRSSIPSKNNSNETKLALQWTISRDDTLSDKYTGFISNRISAKIRDPIYDKTNREIEHLLSMANLKYPKSFNEKQIAAIEEYNLKIQLLK